MGNDTSFNLTAIVEQMYTGSNGWGTIIMQIALAILGVVLFFELTREALDMAAGRGFKLDRKLITLLFVAVFVIGWAAAEKPMYDIPKNVLASSIQKFNEQRDNFFNLQQSMKELTNMYRATHSLGNFMSSAILLWEGNYSEYTHRNREFELGRSLLDVLVLIAFASYLIVIRVGPVFLICFMSEDIRNLGIHWIANLLSYVLLFPVLGIALDISASFMAKSLALLEQLKTAGWNGADPGIKVLQGIIFGPMISLALIIAAFTVVRSLTNAGGAGMEAMTGFRSMPSAMVK